MGNERASSSTMRRSNTNTASLPLALVDSVAPKEMASTNNSFYARAKVLRSAPCGHRAARRGRAFGSITLMRCLALIAWSAAALHGTPREDPPPIQAAKGLFDQSDPRALGLETIPATHTTLYRASPSGYKFCHHSNLAVFNDRLYASWSSGIREEDRDGQVVVFSFSDDGDHWSTPMVLAADPDGAGGELGCVAAGFYVATDELVAYYSTIVDNHTTHVRDRLVAMSSRDGTTWKQKKDLVAGFFIESPRRLRSGRLLMNGQFPHRQPRLLYSDSPDGTSGWKDASIPFADLFGWPEPTWFERRDGSVVMLFRTRTRPRPEATLYASISRDGGSSWTRPAPTNFPCATARTHAGNLSDLTAYIINNPNHNAGEVKSIGRRTPLTIAFSRDGVTFDRAFVVRGEPTTKRFKGLNKLDGFQYPSSTSWKEHLYIAYSINKEDVGISRIALVALNARLQDS